MKYTEYLTQGAQGPQDAPEAQPAEAKPLDAIRAELDAEKFYSLQAAARAIIEAGAEPSALAGQLAAAIFGTDSPEARTVSEAIEKARRPGGYEYAIELARQRRSLYKKQLDALTEQQKALAAQMGLAAAEERELMDSKTEADTANAALLAVMDFSRQLDAGADPGTLLLQAGQLHEKHGGNRPAMGQLFGILTEWQALAWAGLDLVQREELTQLKTRTAEAAGMAS